MIFSFIAYVLRGCRPLNNDEKRKARISDALKGYYLRTTLSATLPVFSAACISTSFMKLIEYIADKRKNYGQIKLSILFVYAFLLCYLFGKLLFYVIHHNHRNYNYIKIDNIVIFGFSMHYFEHFFVENAGFGFKNLFIILILANASNVLGFGPAIGFWMLTFCLIVAFIFAMNILHLKMFRFNMIGNVKMLHFDSGINILIEVSVLN
jgi:hypothetical protein